MKKLIPILLVLSVAGLALAAPNTSKPNGPLNIYIAPDGTGTMVNDGAAPFTFDGYSIASEAGLIAAANWNTIPEQAALDPVNFPPRIGMAMLDAFAWAKMAETAYLISEAHLSATATLQPDDSIVLGTALFPGGTQADLTFTYVNSGTLESYEGYIPEPATMSLLALGGLALIRRRR